MFFFSCLMKRKKNHEIIFNTEKEPTIKIKAQYTLNIEVLVYKYLQILLVLLLLFFFLNIPGHKENVRSNLINLYMCILATVIRFI